MAYMDRTIGVGECGGNGVSGWTFVVLGHQIMDLGTKIKIFVRAWPTLAQKRKAFRGPSRPRSGIGDYERPL
jgi:hypothetical protein